MHKLIARQLAQARQPDGSLDLELFERLVSSAYEELDRDRRRTDRSIGLMVEELDQLNRGLENLVEERTAVLREREGELNEQNLRFDTAINNMSQALLMFDSAARLVIRNDRYIDLYRLPRIAAQRGATLVDLLGERSAAGMFAGDAGRYAEALLTAVARGQSLSQFTELPDGRTIAEVVRPMPGGGWVTTHEDVTERREAEKKIARMARHDALTDLPNRLLLREKLTDAVERARQGERLAVLYLDLDQFKAVNDTLGHSVGDELLKIIGERLQGAVGKNDLVARVGGDEFAVVQMDVRQPTDTAALARRIGEAVREPCELDGHMMMTDTSIGISIAPDDASEPAELLKNADLALYRAKADGRGTFRFFEPEMDARIKARRSTELLLRNALAAGEFELRYQPVVSLSDSRIVCCEALMRWNHPERGLIQPAEFIPVAEEIGLIVPMGEWAMRQACADASRWPSHVRVAVNLSPIQLLSPKLAAVVVSALAESGIPATRLDIEITENVLLQNTATTLATLHRLRQLGVSISMDDFGTGYSSLSYLRAFPFDRLKIDRSFIAGLPDSVDAVAIVRAVAGLARSLAISTTAEGVETAAQMEEVRKMGCAEMQGFYISRPVSADAISAMIAGETMLFARSA